jgi:hypothetical protein
MNGERLFFPEVRLKKLLAEEGGISVGQALENANERLESIRDETLTAVDAKLALLVRLMNSSAANRFAEIYKCANAVFAEAGAFQLKELSEAAHSLCTLTAEEGPIPEAAINVHIAAMRALRAPAAADDADLRAAVISELRVLAAQFGRPRQASA